MPWIELFVATGKPGPPPGGPNEINGALMAAYGQSYVLEHNNTLYMVDASTSTIKWVYQGTSPIMCAAFSPDGLRLAAGSEDKTVHILDAQTGLIERVLEGHTQDVTSVAYSPDGLKMASRSLDGTVKLWDLQLGTVSEFKWENLVNQGVHGVQYVAYSPDGSILAAAGRGDGAIFLWNLETGQGDVLEGHTRTVMGLAFSPNGSQLASASADGSVRIWNMQTDELQLAIQPEADAYVDCVAYSPNGSLLAVGYAKEMLRIFNPATGEMLHEWLTMAGEVYIVTFINDDRVAATCSEGKTLFYNL